MKSLILQDVSELSYYLASLRCTEQIHSGCCLLIDSRLFWSFIEIIHVRRTAHGSSRAAWRREGRCGLCGWLELGLTLMHQNNDIKTMTHIISSILRSYNHDGTL